MRPAVTGRDCGGGPLWPALRSLLADRDGDGGWRYIAVATTRKGERPFTGGVVTHTLAGAENRKAALRIGRRKARRLGLSGPVTVVRGREPLRTASEEGVS